MGKIKKSWKNGISTDLVPQEKVSFSECGLGL